MEEKLDAILESIKNIEARLKYIESLCKENNSNFVREVGANILGDCIYTVLNDAIKKIK